MATQITVLTFNLWGIFNSKHRAARMKHFATKVGEYDVILLQEQFSEEDFEQILSCISPTVRNTRFFQRFPSAYYGSGIAVISRFPIVSAVFSVFPLQGYPERVLHGDYYSNKGAARVCLSVPCATLTADGKTDVVNTDVLVYCTHFVAMYEKATKMSDWRNELYLPIRMSQAVSLADFISTTSRPTDHIIIGGDFNATQRSLEIQTMLVLLRQRGYQLSSVLPLSDTRHTGMHEGARIVNPSMFTFSDANMFNSAEAVWLVEGGDVQTQIDHIFVTKNTFGICSYDDCPDLAPSHRSVGGADEAKSPVGVVVFTKNDEVALPYEPSRSVKIIDSLCALCKAIHCPIPNRIMQWRASAELQNELVPQFCALSDHYGVAVRLQFSPCTPDSKNVEDVVLTAREMAVLREAAIFLESSVKQMYRESLICLRLAAIFGLLVIGNVVVQWYQTREQTRHTERFLERLFTAQSACRAAVNYGVLSETRESGTLGAWLLENLPEMLVGPKNAPKSGGVACKSPMVYSELAAKIHQRGIWQTISPVIFVGCSLFGFGSLAIGLLHRSGNAKIIAEQARMLKRDCPQSQDNNVESGCFPDV